MTFVLPRLVATHDLGELGSGSNQAHVTLDDVPELGELVDPHGPEDSADTVDPGILRRLVGQASLDMSRTVLPASAVGSHCSQFVEAKRGPIEPDSLLRVKDGSPESHQDEEAGEEDHRTEHNEEQEPEDSVQPRFDYPNVDSIGTRRSLGTRRLIECPEKWWLATMRVHTPAPTVLIAPCEPPDSQPEATTTHCGGAIRNCPTHRKLRVKLLARSHCLWLRGR